MGNNGKHYLKILWFLFSSAPDPRADQDLNEVNIHYDENDSSEDDDGDEEFSTPSISVSPAEHSESDWVAQDSPNSASDEEKEEVDDNENNEENIQSQSLAESLAEWAIECNVPYDALRSLIDILLPYHPALLEEWPWSLDEDTYSKRGG